MGSKKVFLFLFFCAHSAAALMAPNLKIDVRESNLEFSYHQRLSMVAEVDEKFGARSLCKESAKKETMLKELPQLSQFGLFGGIYLNTYQQLKTFRDQFLIWERSNSSLNVDVFYYMKAFEQGLPCSESPYIQQKGNKVARWSGRLKKEIDHVDVCVAWYDYFRFYQEQSQKNQMNRRALQRKMWRAHSYSLFHVWVLNYDDYYDSLTKEKVPSWEFYQWNAWNRFVAAFTPSLNLNSCAHTMWPFLGTAMPECSFPDSGEVSRFRQCEESTDLNSPKHYLQWLGLKYLTGFYAEFSELDDSIDAIASEIN